MSIESCTFCRIARGEGSASIVYRDQQVLAFRDIHPVAPIHILIAPVKHIASLKELEPNDEALLTQIFGAARTVATQVGIAEDGYRLVMNSGEDGGQTVFHLHMHLLGGRRMRWPPG